MPAKAALHETIIVRMVNTLLLTFELICEYNSVRVYVYSFVNNSGITMYRTVTFDEMNIIEHSDSFYSADLAMEAAKITCEAEKSLH